MSNLVDIVRGLINSIGQCIPIDRVEDSTLFVCSSTGWLTIGSIIKIDDLEYEVTAVEQNVGITVEPYKHDTAVSSDTTEICQPKITFLHGKPSSVNDEYTLIDEYTKDKTPFLWLYESYDYGAGKRDSVLEAEYRARIFLLDYAKAEEWSNDQHNERVIKPMENLARLIIDYIRSDWSFKDPEVYKVKVHPRFGVDTPWRVDDKKIIDEDLSGVELTLDINMFNLDICNCK